MRARSPGSAVPPGPEGAAQGEAAHEESSQLSHEIVAVPAQTIFMQTVEFLLEVKAMPVSLQT